MQEHTVEIIHSGWAVFSSGGTTDYFCDTALNYPTRAAACKVSALDGPNKP